MRAALRHYTQPRCTCVGPALPAGPRPAQGDGKPSPTSPARPESNVGHSKETTEVEYSQVTFPEGGKKLWLPRQGSVSGQLGRFVFHNKHHHSDYRLFNVKSRIMPQMQ